LPRHDSDCDLYFNKACLTSHHWYQHANHQDHKQKKKKKKKKNIVPLLLIIIMLHHRITSYCHLQLGAPAKGCSLAIRWALNFDLDDLHSQM